MCVCVCVCVCTRARVDVRACVCVDAVRQLTVMAFVKVASRIALCRASTQTAPATRLQLPVNSRLERGSIQCLSNRLDSECVVFRCPRGPLRSRVEFFKMSLRVRQA